jgi:hypothetical protein
MASSKILRTVSPHSSRALSSQLLSIVGLGLGALVLVGMAGNGPMRNLSPLTALIWGVASLACAVPRLASSSAPRSLLAEAAFAVALAAFATAIIDVAAFTPCGFDCLR